MSDLIPSRFDENFRYTQIGVSDSGWSDEQLSNTESSSQSDVAPWINDFYYQTAEGMNRNKIVHSHEDWLVARSSSLGPKSRGCCDLVVAAGQTRKVFEVLENESEGSLHIRDIRVEEGATLEYFILQNHSANTTFILRHFIDVKPGAKVVVRFFHVGAKKGQHRIAARVAKNANFTVEGATKLKDAQHIDIWAESQHEGPDSRSQTTVWNVLSDSAIAVFNGMIRILQGCPKTEAYQSNKTLLLSEKSRVYTLPKLEIATDDVKCSHGASVSSLDPTQLFYLQSRGINPLQAEQMLVEAFTYPVLQFIPKHLLSPSEIEKLSLTEDIHAF